MSLAELAQQANQFVFIAYAQAGSFVEIKPQLLDLVRQLFSGWGQSAIHERANRVLRDAQTRDAPSKALAHA